MISPGLDCLGSQPRNTPNGDLLARRMLHPEGGGSRRRRWTGDGRVDRRCSIAVYADVAGRGKEREREGEGRLGIRKGKSEDGPPSGSRRTPETAC